jgi:hypothetical protein
MIYPLLFPRGDEGWHPNLEKPINHAIEQEYQRFNSTAIDWLFVKPSVLSTMQANYFNNILSMPTSKLNKIALHFIDKIKRRFE